MILSVPTIIEKCVSLKHLWMTHWKIWLWKDSKIPVHQIFIAVYKASVRLPYSWMIGQLINMNVISKTINHFLSFLSAFIIFLLFVFLFLSCPPPPPAIYYWIQLRFRSMPNLDSFLILINKFAGLAALPRLVPFCCIFGSVFQQIKQLTWKDINHSYSLGCIKYVHSKSLEQH